MFDKFLNKLSAFGLFAVLIVPLDSADQWKLLKYRKIKPNKVSFQKQGLKIDVDGSAMPLIYPLKEKTKVKSISINGELGGLLNIKSQDKQGAKNYDDYGLQVGLVVSGEKTLNFFQRSFAAKWVKTLFKLAPKGEGVDHILFLRANQHADPDMKTITHSLGKGLIKGKSVWRLNKEGPFELAYELPQALEVVALWISVDGDDTLSKYSVLIKEIKIEKKEDTK